MKKKTQVRTTKGPPKWYTAVNKKKEMIQNNRDEKIHLCFGPPIHTKTHGYFCSPYKAFSRILAYPYPPHGEAAGLLSSLSFLRNHFMELILRCTHRFMRKRQLNSNSQIAGGTWNYCVLLCRGHRTRKCFFMCVMICPFYGVCVCVRETLVSFGSHA